MSVLTHAQTAEGEESIDLAVLGEAYRPTVPETPPEVSDVIATMPWWASRGLLYLIAGFIITALMWAGLSKVDMVVESRGALVPEGHVQPVQAAGGGIVQSVLVREGETVLKFPSVSRGGSNPPLDSPVRR